MGRCVRKRRIRHRHYRAVERHDRVRRSGIRRPARDERRRGQGNRHYRRPSGAGTRPRRRTPGEGRPPRQGDLQLGRGCARTDRWCRCRWTSPACAMWTEACGTALRPALDSAERERTERARKESEAAARHYSDLLDSIIATMADAVLVVDTAGKTLFANPACQGAVRRSRRHRFGRLAEDLSSLPPDGDHPLSARRDPVRPRRAGRELRQPAHHLPQGRGSARHATSLPAAARSATRPAGTSVRSSSTATSPS